MNDDELRDGVTQRQLEESVKDMEHLSERIKSLAGVDAAKFASEKQGIVEALLALRAKVVSQIDRLEGGR